MSEKTQIVRKREGAADSEYGPTERYGGADYEPVHQPAPGSDDDREPSQ